MGQILETRYRIVSHISAGGFGRTYLAEDLHRFNERCVLKEFAPHVKTSRDLQKAKELFEREASAIYKLNHSQLPKFRELFQADLGDGEGCLFLAQDYIDGKTYADLLKSQGKLPETEVKELLCQLLPVLSYIHSQGVIHRDISPDNLIKRHSDNLPVLIDFGGVKQLAANAVLNLTPTGKIPTLLGKEGYAPEEQLKQGQVFPNSDFYALGVTAVVLLTGKKPQELYDGYKGTWYWGKEIKVTSQLENILKKMLAYKPSDRYQSANDLLQALQSANPGKIPNQNISQMRTMVVAPANPASPGTQIHPSPSQTIVLSNGKGFLQKWATRITGMSLAVVTGISIWLGFNWLIQATRSIALSERKILRTINFSEKDRAAKLLTRRKALGMSEVDFNTKVNQRFYAKHPELRGRLLTSSPEDAHLREEWYRIAEDLVDQGI